MVSSLLLKWGYIFDRAVGRNTKMIPLKVSLVPDGCQLSYHLEGGGVNALEGRGGQ